MRARSVISETSAAPITKQEATVDYASTHYVIVGVHDTPYDGQWGLWAMRPAGRKVHMGTLFGFDDAGHPRIWISRSGLPKRAADPAATDPTWREPKHEAATRMIELRDAVGPLEAHRSRKSALNDEHGCSECVIAGDERFQTFRSKLAGGGVLECWHYDYRSHNGELFTTIADTLEECRGQRDSWLAEHHAAEYYDLKQSELDAGDAELCEGSGR